MRINRIELYNIGSYEGLNVFDISGQNKDGKISVIGGKNGAGKTTLFSGIKLCLYGHRESGYQAINAWYKNSIKRLINDKAKLENNATAYVQLDLSLFNGQDWVSYILKREWDLNDAQFEKFTVIRDSEKLNNDEIYDFDNYLLNLIPPELFDLYFFDGEQIADFFLEESNGGKIKSAFLTICGYDTFDILYKNFKRLARTADVNNTALDNYFKAEDDLRLEEKKLQECNDKIVSIVSMIEEVETELAGKEKEFSAKGGVSIEEWNDKFLQLKNEERIREEKNTWLKNAANEIIPYVILREEIEQLHQQMISEEENIKKQIISDALKDIIPRAISNVKKHTPELTSNIENSILRTIAELAGTDTVVENNILNLSKEEYHKLIRDIVQLTGFNSQEVLDARTAIKQSIKNSQSIREDIETSNVADAEKHLKEKEDLIEKKALAVEELKRLYDEQKELITSVERLANLYKSAEKSLDKHLKGESVSALTTRSIKFLDKLQKRLFESEIAKVEKLFMYKMNQLMRKEKFISNISIDNDFNIHVYKHILVDTQGICERINHTSIEAYKNEFGEMHCNAVLKASNSSDLQEFVEKYSDIKENLEVVLEFDKATMSKGEKQVFIMALYWAIMQLCNKEIPFIIDTPFARIDTIHRAHITEHFFKELKGQVLIFSTDEEITPEHMDVIGSDLQSKFLIENVDNKKTVITANKYFGE